MVKVKTVTTAQMKAHLGDMKAQHGLLGPYQRMHKADDGQKLRQYYMLDPDSASATEVFTSANGREWLQLTRYDPNATPCETIAEDMAANLPTKAEALIDAVKQGPVATAPQATQEPKGTKEPANAPKESRAVTVANESGANVDENEPVMALLRIQEIVASALLHESGKHAAMVVAMRSLAKQATQAETVSDTKH